MADVFVWSRYGAAVRERLSILKVVVRFY